MVQRKSFNTASDSDEPVIFDINDVVFHCRPQISAGIVMKMGELFGGGEDGIELGEDSTNVKEIIQVIREFFDFSLMPDDRVRFNAMLNDPDQPIPLQTLIDISTWLTSIYTGNRPTGQSSPDTSVSQSPGDVSMGSASPVVSISGSSRQIVPST